eukprot:12792529-Alexandrium_andersonii.AAC.1
MHRRSLKPNTHSAHGHRMPSPVQGASAPQKIPHSTVAVHGHPADLALRPYMQHFGLLPCCKAD